MQFCLPSESFWMISISMQLHTCPLLCCSSWNDGAYEFALENQAGEGLRFDDPQDRKALVMGLALHEQGKQILQKVLL